MNKAFQFRDLFIFEIANNHQGEVEHGRRLIRELGEIARRNNIRASAKLQMRELDTFIHPAHRVGSPNPHVSRFLSTRLRRDDYVVLLAEIRAQGLVAMCTPFDEPSVDEIVRLDFDVVKIGSPSATDWPLIEAVASCGKPVIFSTGGLTLKQIDDVVSFFDHRRVDFAIMHCVSIYPTPPEHLQLNQIDVLRNRYPDRVIGFSTHEPPDDLTPVHVAVAKGARILERHVGVLTDTLRLNAYSSTPEQLERWVMVALAARAVCGAERRPAPTAKELASLDALKRGVFAARDIESGETLGPSDISFAMPWDRAIQLGVEEWRPGVVAAATLRVGEPVRRDAVRVPVDPDRQMLFTAIHEIKGMLNEARIRLNTEFMAEFSHHYGLAQFARYGATIIECVNRGYCKKLVILLPGQSHPNHYHKRKEETFQVLHGVLEIEIEGRHRVLHPGDTALVQQGVWHRFWSDCGVIVEEISSTHFNDDSFYEDKTINALDRSQRKTIVNNWGRYQI